MGRGEAGSGQIEETVAVAAAQAGDESAFAGLVTRYRPAFGLPRVL